MQMHHCVYAELTFSASAQGTLARQQPATDTPPPGLQRSLGVNVSTRAHTHAHAYADVSLCAYSGWRELTFSASAQQYLSREQPAADTPPPALQRALGDKVSTRVSGSKGGGRKREKRDHVPSTHTNISAQTRVGRYISANVALMYQYALECISSRMFVHV